MNPTSTPAPTRHIAGIARRITTAELDRLARQVATQPFATAFKTVSETSGKVRTVTRTEAEWLLAVTGKAVAA